MKLRSPATARNKAPIAAVLAQVLPPYGVVLEVASGAGEHIVHFAERFPEVDWVASDKDPDALVSIKAWVDDAKRKLRLDNLGDPILFDVEKGGWPDWPITAVLCINMVHISPWSTTEKLLHGAAATFDLARADGGPVGPLILYGPYRREGMPTAPSNEAFDRSLRERDPRWGLRTVEAMAAEAAKSGLRLNRVVEMPANNLMLIF